MVHLHFLMGIVFPVRKHQMARQTKCWYCNKTLPLGSFPVCEGCRDRIRINPSPSIPSKTPREQLIELIATELDNAYAKHGREPWGRHEFYAILQEEVDELWDDIKADSPQELVIRELIQVAAMCFRYYETGDRYRGPHGA